MSEKLLQQSETESRFRHKVQNFVFGIFLSLILLRVKVFENSYKKLKQDRFGKSRTL